MRRMTAWVWLMLGTLCLAQVPAPQVPEKPTPEQSPVRLMRTEAATGLEFWETRLGTFWIPAPAKWVISNLEWEQVDRKIYDYTSCRVQPGDIVIDCGAHVGVFTRVALRGGARMVVAIEPEEKILAAFRRNFQAELQSGKVKLVAKGIWDKAGTLSLRLSDNSNDAHSLVFDDNRKSTQSIQVTTLDQIEQSLGLPRVDFIKMDIEGAEPRALRGARRIIARWRPRMAISSYHVAGDPAAIAAFAWEVRPDYRIASKDLVKSPHGAVVPKVLFFY